MILPKGKREDLRKLKTMEEWTEYMETHDMSDAWDQLLTGELPWETDAAGNDIYTGDDPIDEA